MDTAMTDVEFAALTLSVYRHPIDMNAALFQLGEADAAAAYTPDRRTAMQRMITTFMSAKDELRKLESLVDEAAARTSTPSIPDGPLSSLADDVRTVYEKPRSPRRPPPDFDSLMAAMAQQGLIIGRGDTE